MSPGHSPGTARRARGSQGPKAATQGPQALGQPASQASWPPSRALRRSPLQKPRALHAFLSAERGETTEQGVESDGEPLPRPGASPVSWGHVSRPPRPRANRWGGGARPVLPGTAPHPGAKAGVCGQIVKRVIHINCTPYTLFGLPSTVQRPPTPDLEDGGPHLLGLTPAQPSEPPSSPRGLSSRILP